VVLTTETAHNSSYKQVKKKKSGLFGSKRSTTTTTSQSLTNQGTHLSSGGDLTIASGGDVLLAGSKATAEGDISVQAAGDIQLLSAVDQSSQRYQQQKKGTFKVKAKDQGFIKQTAVTSDLIGGGNISLDSGSNITLEGATLAAKDTLSIGTDAMTQNANGQYVNDKGELAGNVTVTTQALESSEWSESSSSFRGVFKDLVKGIAVIASTVTAGLIHGEIKVGESDATRTDTLSQQTTTLAAADLDLTAQQDLTLIGAQVAVSDTANLTAQNVTIDAAQERTVTSTSHTDQTVSGEGASFSSEKGELTLASVTETDRTERTTTTANTWAGSNLQAGNLNIKADKNVAIIASDVSVQNDANIEGENVLIGGREDTYDTTNETTTKTKTLTVGVKNAYADTYLAVRALDQAKDAVKDAEKAYEDAKQKVAEGKLQQSDLDGYEIALNSAKNTEKYAAIAVANAAAGAAMSSGTAGFTASAGVTLQTTTTSTTNNQSAWNGSSIQVGNNANLQGEDTLTVKGSNVAVGSTLIAEADQINVLAGENTTQQSTKSNTQSASVSASVGKVDFSDVASSAGVNTSTSSSESQSTQYTNSQLTAGAFVSRSDQLNIKGGTLHGEQVSIDTGDLNIASVQDSSSSNSRSDSVGINLGSSVSSEGTNLGLSYQQSTTDSDYQSVTQQSGITSGDQGYQIQVANHTSLTGAIITSTQTAEDKGLNSLSTASLTASDLENHANFSGSSVGVDASYNTAENGGFSRSQGYGETADNRTRTTQNGINTANLTITDAEQQAQTGQSVEQVLADVGTATTTDTVAQDSGALQDHFDQAEVLEQVNTMRTVTQETNQTVQQIRLSLNKKADELKAQLKEGAISQEQYDSEANKLNAYGLIASSIGAGLTAPTDSVSGQVAAAASPALSYSIGQYFKGQAAANADGELSGGQEAAHVLAHGILAAAVAAEGGNDATTAGLAAAGSEAAAPMLANWLYGSSDPDDLDAQQKQTLTNILGAASMVAASTGSGDASDVVAAGQLADNAVENNFLCGGVCVGVGVAAIAAYLASEGEGDLAEGVMKIGRGEDTISETLDDINEAVDAAAYEVAPEFTQAVADIKSDLGSFTNEVVTYVDEKTGKTVSGAWNKLDPKTQEFLKGSGVIFSVVVPTTRTASLTTPDLKLTNVAKSSDDKDLSGSIGDGSDLGSNPYASYIQPDEVITDPNRLLANPSRDPNTGELDPNYRAPEVDGGVIVSYPAAAGIRVQQAIDESYQVNPVTGQAQNPGSFTTRDNIDSVDQVRNDLAVKNEFKKNITHVQEYEIKEGTRIQESEVGPQVGSDGAVYQGGGNQVQIISQPGLKNSDVLIPIGEPRPIK